MGKKLGLRPNRATAALRTSPRFKPQNPNQPILSSHHETLSTHQHDLKSIPSSVNLKRKDSRKKTMLGGKQTCLPSIFENVAEKDAALCSGSNQRRSSRLAEIGTTSIPQNGFSYSKKMDRMVTKFGVKQTCPSSVYGNDAKKDAALSSVSNRRRSSRLAKIGTTSMPQNGFCEKDAASGSVNDQRTERRLTRLDKVGTTSITPDGFHGLKKMKSTAQPQCGFSLERRRSPRFASVDTASSNSHFEVTEKSRRCSKSNKRVSPNKNDSFSPSVCPSTVRNNSSEENCIREPTNNCSKGTRKSRRLATLSNKLEETNGSEASQIGCASQQFLPTIREKASEKAATLASKPPLPPIRRRSTQITNQSDEITRKETKSKYVEESDSDHESEESPVEKGKKRKREESAETEAPVECIIGELRDCSDKWTEEQEIALQKAYFLAKPSPHFWKKVSKMVPGKNAQECYNRIQSNFTTPPSTVPRRRLNKASQLDSPFRKFDLLELNGTAPKACKVSKQKKTRDARKTLRHLLKKQQLVDQVQEADYFSQFEASPVNLPSDVKLPSDLSCKERLNSIPEKNLKPGPSQKQPDPSPAVLKRVKNMELHEKYIDHLHCVDVRRKACVRNCGNKGKEVDLGTKAGDIRDAKTALVSEAQDFIGCFKRLQADPFGNCAPSDEDDEDGVV